MKRICLALVLVLALCWLACEPTKKPAGEEGKVVATVNGIKITDQQLLQMLEAIRDPRQLAMFGDMEGKKMLVNKIVDMELINAAARREGMQNDAEVRRFIETYTKQVLFIAYLQKKMKEKAKEITEEQARQFYDQHPNDFEAPESAHLRQILIKVDAEADEATTAAAEKKAKEALAKIKAGADFAAIAKKYSDDTGNRDRGGDLGFIPRGRMEESLDQAAFALEVGQVSDVIKTSRGFHILKVEEKKPAGKREFEEVKAIIMARLRMQAQQDAYDAIVNPLRAGAKINIDEAALQAFQAPQPQMPGMQGMPGGMQNAQPGNP